MNIKHLFFSLFAVAALAGCSSDDAVVSTDSDIISDGTPRYMTVNIVSSPSAETRAEEKGDPNNAIYEDGTGNENSVNNVRFYFFTDDGAATAIKADGKNYYDYISPTGELDNKDPNIEKVLDAVIVISTKEGDRIPSRMVAVVNGNQATLGSSNLSLSELRNLTSNFAASANAGRFVMMNSVYRDAGLQRVDATAITTDNLKTDSVEAKKSPVVMYVERNVAKVSLQIGEDAKAETANGVTYIPLVDKDDNPIIGENSKQIYLKLTGWNLTATTNLAYLSKHINTAWKVDLFDSTTPWNYYPYFRSYWATNVGTDDNGTDQSGKEYFSYDAIGTTQLNANNVKYTNENAATDYTSGKQREHPTQAIIAGKLVYKDESGNVTPINLGEFAGSVVYSEADLISTMVSQLSQSLYKKVDDSSVEGGVAYKSITADDVKLITAEDRDVTISSDEATGRYYVELALNNENSTWYKYNEDKTFTEYTNDQVTEILHSIQGKMWQAGNTYYSFKINHLGENKIGKYGIVRNHSYKVTIDKVVGLGTPVYDNTKTIYPEVPEEKDTYIAAKVNILSWRVVPSTVTLGE